MTRRLLFVVIFLGLFILFGFGRMAASRAAAEPASLVQIDIQGQSDLVRLEPFRLSIYAQLVSPSQDTYLLAPLSASQVDALAELGIHYVLLDPEIGDGGYQIAYFPTPEQLDYFGENVLANDGRHAILRAAVYPLAEPALAGATIRDLSLHPLVPPGDDFPPDIPLVLTPDPVIQGMMNQVDSQAAYDWIGGLSGEWPVQINGNPYTIATRYTPAATPIQKATRYVHEFLGGLGLSMDYDYYTLPGVGERRNVIAEQVGVTQPERVFMLTAHLDSTTYQNPMALAPGADDNASGSTGVLMAAEIMSQYDFGCTLRYALFTGEEQGLYGSKAYSAEVYARGDQIEAVLNIDMIGYNGDSAPYLQLHTRPNNAADLAIATLFSDVVDAYNIGLWPVVYGDGLSFSDHSSFWTYGYPAILAIEEYYGDFNPYYHSNNDRLSAIDLAYLKNAIKAALGTFAHMGCEIDPQIPTPTPVITPVYLFDTFLPASFANPPAPTPTPD
jgi:hypothetical protein